MSVNDNPSVAGVLPVHLRGRQAHGGPTSGGYIYGNISAEYIHNLTTGTQVDSAAASRIYMLTFGPAVRILSVTVTHNAKTGTTPTFAVYNADHATPVGLIGVTALGSVNVVQSFGGNDTAFAAQSARYIPQNGRLRFTIATGVDEDITGLVCNVVGYVVGHDQDDPADD